MGRKLEVVSAFAYGGQYIVPLTVHLLDNASLEELEPYFAAGCLREVEENPSELPKYEPGIEPESAPVEESIPSLDEHSEEPE